MVNSLYHLIGLLFFDIPLLYFYIVISDLISSLIFCLSSGDIYLSISISSSFPSELFFGEVF